MKKRIGILGGTFNPIHKGHLDMAKVALKEFSLDKVIFMPTGLPPHKGHDDLVAKKHRLAMVELAVEKFAKYEVSKAEIRRPGYSYAIDTFKRLRRRVGKTADLFYIMGMDSINDILSWKRPMELLGLCDFIVLTRPGACLRTFNRIIKFPPLRGIREKIHLAELNVNLASRVVRERIKEGKPVLAVLPKNVLSYIKKHNLYQ